MKRLVADSFRFCTSTMTDDASHRGETGMRNRRFPILLAAAVLGLGAAIGGLALQGADEKPDPDYGTITGQFVVDGAVPPARVLVAAGAAVNNAAICAANPIPSEELVVDEKTGAIANVFIFLPTAKKIHPALKVSKVKQVVFDQQACRFVPHALFARTDQKIVIKSNDACPHNTHLTSLRNESFNTVIAANDRKGTEVQLKVVEKRPVPVECNLHPWMKANWLILDHPYAAISNEQGRFTIADLPAGDHEFWIWQELMGDVDRAHKVKVKGGQTVDLGKIVIPAEKLLQK